MTTSPRDRIVGSALALIAERGLGGVTMTAVAAEAGVSRQTLYNHFADIDEVVVAVLEQHGEAVHDHLRSLLAAIPDPVGKIEQIVRHRMANAGHGDDIALLVAGLSREAQARIAQHSAVDLRMIEQVLEEGVAAGCFRADLDPGSMAAVIQRMLGSASELVESEGDLAAASSVLAAMVLGSLSTGG